ncbi:hypothetical protein Hypma_003999 [Hypsizygus marmoreus]|uniref:Uncharacterized protein n=1 Tax=Hypsizygus marmoreus TaxID=39966 RepID=A0A369J0X7_HYPMA|nr:hypothetical protein Hypma_003999 [Hypsizygus marmoreus]
MRAGILWCTSASAHVVLSPALHRDAAVLAGEILPCQATSDGWTANAGHPHRREVANATLSVGTSIPRALASRGAHRLVASTEALSSWQAEPVPVRYRIFIPGRGARFRRCLRRRSACTKMLGAEQGEGDL